MNKILLILSLFVATLCNAQAPIFALSSDRLLLDNPAIASGNQLAYSFYKLRAGYTGSCIRVVRSGDNAQRDIGFVNNFLDTTDLLTWAGSASAFVITWYNQSPNSTLNATSVIGGNPIIVDAGVLVRENGLAALRMRVGFSLDYLRISLSGNTMFSNVPYVAAATVIRPANNTKTGNVFTFGEPPPGQTIYQLLVNLAASQEMALGVRRLSTDAVQRIIANPHSSAQMSFTGVLDYANSDAYLFRNGVQVAFSSSYQTAGNSNSASNRVNIGANNADGTVYEGTIQEVLAWNANIQSQLNRVHASQIKRYRIP
jgi:hypothetical protein